jgi:lysyl-tRNA synthetase class I
MSLNYALVTSSSLPNKIRKSPHYVSVDKAQWLDLVDYSQDLVTHDPEQKVLFLIVAKGTEEQESADAEREKMEELAQEEMHEQSAAQAEAKQEDQENKLKLRSKSKSIFNALYGR